MKSKSILSPINVENFKDLRGNLCVAEISLIQKFDTKRIYYISGVPQVQSRGAHGHKKLKQIFFAVSGSFSLIVTDGLSSETVQIQNGGVGYYLPEGYWRELSEFTPDAVCLVLASENYDEGDYIYSYDEFLRWKNNG